jgi:hypothetical protein
MKGYWGFDRNHLMHRLIQHLLACVRAGSAEIPFDV